MQCDGLRYLYVTLWREGSSTCSKSSGTTARVVVRYEYEQTSAVDGSIFLRSLLKVEVPRHYYYLEVVGS